MNEKVLVNVEDELLKINSKMIFEFSKTVEDMDYENIEALKVEDGDKTLCFLFYGSDFFAFNQINFRNQYEYNQNKDFIAISENLNDKIKKIPNVAKTRGILKIDDIETRIYDMNHYILLLNKENKRILKVEENTNLSDMNFEEYKLDMQQIKEKVQEYSFEEEERIKEEKSLKNRIKIFKNSIKEHILEPIKIIKNKLFHTQKVKLLNEGKHSIFDK